MAEIFISYIHQDSDIASALHRILRSRFGDVFLAGDPYEVRAGEVWLDQIRRALNEARIVILMLSPRSMPRPWIYFEAGAAWLAEKILIPVCYGTLRRDQLVKPYSDFQAVDLTERHGVSNLVSSLGQHFHGLPGLMELARNTDFERLRELALQSRPES
jgi:hypothetical protein